MAVECSLSVDDVTRVKACNSLWVCTRIWFRRSAFQSAVCPPCWSSTAACVKLVQHTKQVCAGSVRGRLFFFPLLWPPVCNDIARFSKRSESPSASYNGRGTSRTTGCRVDGTLRFLTKRNLLFAESATILRVMTSLKGVIVLQLEWFLRGMRWGRIPAGHLTRKFLLIPTRNRATAWTQIQI